MAWFYYEGTPATMALCMYELKTLLVSAGWVVKSSSDASSLGYNASGDNINNGGSGSGGMANNSAWFRIQSPAGAGTPELTVQRGTTNALWRIKFSQSNAFTAGSPGATQTPSATNERIDYGGGTDASPSFATLFTGTEGAQRFKAGADGSSPYGWWAGSFPSGGGSPTAALCFDPLVGTESTDGSKNCLYLAGSNAYASAQMATENAGSTNHIRAYLAAVTPTTGVDVCCMLYASGTATHIPSANGTNPITAKDEIYPIPLNRRGAQASPGWKGLTTIMKWTGVSRTTGDTQTVSTTRDRIVFGSVSLPWNGSVPAV